MTREEALKLREETVRASQLELYKSLQYTLNELSNEMLGDAKWNRDLVDNDLRNMMDELVEHFGMGPLE